jgi:hypothetical protein
MKNLRKKITFQRTNSEFDELCMERDHRKFNPSTDNRRY